MTSESKSSIHPRWRTDGYVLVPGLIDLAQAEQLHTICSDILAQWRACDPQTGTPGEKSDATVMRHLNHPAYFSQHPEWLSTLLDAVANPNVLRVVAEILGEPPLFRCTSLFFNPSAIRLDGNWHRDSQFMVKKDDDAAERALLANMSDTGVGMQLQIALIPSDDIELVPGSHLRWDTPEEFAIRKADGWAHNRANTMPGALRVHQAAGDAVLFNPAAIHRGRYYSDIPRSTLMLTYTKVSEPYSDFFSNQPWFIQPGYMDHLSPATRAFFEPFVAQYESYWRSSV